MEDLRIDRERRAVRPSRLPVIIARLLVLAIALLATAALSQAPAGAADEGVNTEASTTSSGGVVAITGTDSDGNPGSTYVDPCMYKVDTWFNLRGEISAWEGVYIPDGLPPVLTPEGTVHPNHEFSWMFTYCPNEEGTLVTVDLTQLGEPPDVISLLEAAKRALNAPLPDVQFSPPAGVAKVVGIDTWMWIEGPEQTDDKFVEVCIMDWVCAQLTATLNRLDLAVETGDPAIGTTVVTCIDGGIAYDPRLGDAAQRDVDNCGWVWTYDGDFTVTATSYWDLAWACSYTDAPPGPPLPIPCPAVGALGQVDRPAPAQQVIVEQWQSQITGN